MKRFLIMTITVTMLMSMNIYANQENIQDTVDMSVDDDEAIINIVEDNEYRRIVESENEYGTVTLIFDKATNTMTVIDPFGDEQSYSDEDYYRQKDSKGYSTRGVIAEESTYSNFEYVRYSNGKWRLRRPKNGMYSAYYFDIYQNSKNKADILKFRDSVEYINTQEIYVIGSGIGGIGGSILAFSSAIGTSGALTPQAYYVAAGLSGNYLYQATLLGERQEQAYEEYFVIYYGL